MICPFASYLPVGNHGGPMSGHIGLVLHVKRGNGSLYGYFDNPASQVGASAPGAPRPRRLEQYLDTDPDGMGKVARKTPNTSSVETEGVDTESLTQAQVSTVARLLTWCANAYGFPVTGPVPHGTPGFTPHCNPNGTPDPAWGNHPCPGSLRLAQMPTIIAATHPQPTTKEYEVMDSTTAANGDIVSHAILTPQGHYFEITRKAGVPEFPGDVRLSIIDITAQYPQFSVQP